MIRKTSKTTWKLYSADGRRHLGTFKSLSAAREREAEIKKIEYLKEHGIPPRLHKHMSHKPFRT